MLAHTVQDTLAGSLTLLATQRATWRWAAAMLLESPADNSFASKSVFTPLPIAHRMSEHFMC